MPATNQLLTLRNPKSVDPSWLQPKILSSYILYMMSYGVVFGIWV